MLAVLALAAAGPDEAAAAGAKRRPAGATAASTGSVPAAGSAKPDAKTAPAASAAGTANRPGAAAPQLRLGNLVQPQAAWLALAIDPAQPRYTGTAEYDISLAQPLSDIVLHAKGLKVSDAWLDAGARRLTAKVSVLDAERIGLRFAKPLAAGKARLGLAFAGELQAAAARAGAAPAQAAGGRLPEPALRGQVRQSVNGRWLVHTRFLPAGARLAFPAFDEPGWKLPWVLSLSAPQGYEALANMPTPAAEPADRPGWQTWRFAATPPLASHGLAWALGQWAVTTGPAAGDLPLRMVSPAGLDGDRQFAATATAALVSALEAYLDQPLPAAKLDSLALPGATGIGADAAAQPGLLAYDAAVLLATPGQDDAAFQRRYLAQAAQALAQQWFGHLVGMAWWDDWWLNQALAASVADQVVQDLKPDGPWQAHRQQQARARAMAADQQPDARSLQQPVASSDDLARLISADGPDSRLRRDKGQALLAMAEGWIGPQAWRDSLRRYLQRHAWGHATQADFLRALGEADAHLPAIIGRFAQQPGVPLLQVQAVCDDGPPRLVLRQQPLVNGQAAAPAGSRIQAGAPRPLPLPLPLRLRTAAGERRLLMTEASATLPLTGEPCPTWVQANVGGQGYYRVAYGPGLSTLPPNPAADEAAPATGATADASASAATKAGAGPVSVSANGPRAGEPRFLQSTAELLALLDDANALHQAGLMDSTALRTLAQAHAADARPEVAMAVAALLKP